MTSLYRSIIAKAWEITKKHKFLWVFGFFAAFLGNAIEFKSLFIQLDNIKNNSDVYFSFNYYITLWAQVAQTISQLPVIHLLTMVLMMLFVLLVAIVFIWLIINSQTAIIRSASKINDGKKVDMKESFLKGVKYFWPVLGLNILGKFIVFLILSLFVSPLLVIFIAKGAQLSLFLTLLMIVIFVPLAIIIGFVTKYAINYAVLKGQKCWQAFISGWKLFANHWLISVEMALLVLVVNAALAFLLSLLSILLVAPFILIGLTSSTTGLLYILMSGSVGLIAIIFFLAAAIFSTWQNTAWTLLFIKLEKGGVFPKIVRWVAGTIAKRENK
jgi:hypothetical protein